MNTRDYNFTPEEMQELRIIATEAVRKVQAKRRKDFIRTETPNGTPLVTNFYNRSAK